MAQSEISLGRLLVNAAGCAIIAALCLPGAFWFALTFETLQPPRPDDPDGPKALGFMVLGILFCGAFGIGALIDLIRTVRRIRRLAAEPPR
jgi:hypothetical protein